MKMLGITLTQLPPICCDLRNENDETNKRVDRVHGKGDGIVVIDEVHGKDHDGVQESQNDNLSPRIAIDFGAGAKTQSGALT